MKKTLFYLPLFLLSGYLAADEVNLASKDPGMEEGYKYFYSMRPKAFTSIVKGVGSNGSMGLRICNPNPDPVRRSGLYRKGLVEALPGKDYTFSVKFRGKLTAGYASARVNAVKRDGKKYKVIKTFESCRVSGEKDYQLLRLTFRTPPGTELINYELSARNYCGEIFFDDVFLAQNNGNIRIPLVKDFQLDGKWNENFAKKALLLYSFQNYPINESNPIPPDATKVYLALDGENLCGMILLEHDKNRPIKRNVKHHDGPAWLDESCELFITHTNNPRPYYHFILSPGGGVYDALENDSKWNSNMKTAVAPLSANCFMIQFSLPLKDVGYNPELDAHMHKLVWKMNFTRSHHQSTQVRYSSFAKVISFHNPAAFPAFEGLNNGKKGEISLRYAASGESVNSQSTNGAGVSLKRVWEVKKPLYKELLSNTPNPLAGESAFIWPRPIEEKDNIRFGLQYGMEYTLEDILAQYQKYRLHPYSSPDFSRLAKWGEKSGVGVAVYAPYHLNNFSFLYSPEGRKKFLSALEDLLKKHHKGIWAVSFGDEVFSQVLRRFISRANNPKELAKDPDLRKAVEEIRTRYGSGKYGIPKSPADNSNPFHWIATRRWALDQMLETQKSITGICAKYKGCNGKKILIISPDHVDWAFMQHQSRFAPYQDIVCAQSVPANDPTRQVLAFRAKLLKDLTEKNVWLCAHVEPYTGNYSNKETAAFLSEAVRGGATGFQLWNYDYIGDLRKMGGSRFDYYGHRPRWETIMECLERVRKDPLPKYPAPSYQVLLSNDTAFALPKMKVPEPEYFFNLFGASAGSWFSFISDVQLLDGKKDLKDSKLLFIPKGNILEKAIAGKLEKFLENGGCLISFDPEIMEFAPNGENTKQLREKLFGAVTREGSGENILVIPQNFLPSWKEKFLLNATGSRKYLLPAKGTKVLAKYSSSRAAITCKDYPNGGKAILISCELKSYQSSDKKYQAFAKALLQSRGVKTDLEYWNFLYPHKEEKEAVNPLQCLTGNNLYFWNNAIKTPNNVQLPGSYYTVKEGNAPLKRFSFADGNFTNRLKAPGAGDWANYRRNKDIIQSGKLHGGLFADTFKGKAPLEITFHFGRKTEIRNFKLFYQGRIADFTVTGENGKIHAVKGGRTNGVKAISFTFPAPLKSSFLSFRIPAGGLLTISEVEVWGKSSAK